MPTIRVALRLVVWLRVGVRLLVPAWEGVGLEVTSSFEPVASLSLPAGGGGGKGTT
jgi:hypothetical protein